MVEKTMPVWLYDEQRTYAKVTVQLPWAMFAPHSRQAETNHSQTLDRLAERGGLDSCEALAILDDRRWHTMPPTESNQEICRRWGLFMASTP